jgi:hypothetical protein
MIDLIIVILIFVIFIVYQMIPMPIEIKDSLSLILVSFLLFYIAFNINDATLSRMFAILGIFTLLLIPIIIIVRYMDKLNPQEKQIN